MTVEDQGVKQHKSTQWTGDSEAESLELWKMRIKLGVPEVLTVVILLYY